MRSEFCNKVLYDAEFRNKNFDYIIIRFIKEYIEEISNDLCIKTNVSVIDLNKYARMIKLILSPNNKVLGVCYGNNDININLYNIRLVSFMKKKDVLFYNILRVMNHELSHAYDNYQKPIYGLAPTVEFYSRLRFELLESFKPELYDKYYKYFNLEIKAFENEFSKTLPFVKNDIIKKEYEKKLNSIRTVRCLETYDIANIDTIDHVIKDPKIKDNEVYKNNKIYFDIEFNKDGTRRKINELLNIKNHLKEYVKALYCDDISFLDEYFNIQGYYSIIKDRYFLRDVKYDDQIIEILNHGIDYEKERIENNRKYKSVNQEENEKYLVKQLEKNCTYKEFVEKIK